MSTKHIFLLGTFEHVHQLGLEQLKRFTYQGVPFSFLASCLVTATMAMMHATTMMQIKTTIVTVNALCVQYMGEEVAEGMLESVLC